VEDASNALGASHRIVEQDVPPVGADVVEAPDLHILASHHDDVLTTRVTESSVVVRVGELRLVTGDDPALVEYLLLLFPEDLFVGIDPGVYKVSGRQSRVLLPFN
jgi:hypothetical protein